MKIAVLFQVFFLLLSSVHTYSQSNSTIKGCVTDASTGEPIPFANVAIKGSLSGTITDFEGHYQLNYKSPADSIAVTYVGYTPRSKPIALNQVEQTIDFQLAPNVFQLQEVKIYAGENPAHAIIRKVVANQKKNNTDNLDAYQYESYNKIQIDIDNISDKFRKSKAVGKITHIVEQYDQIKGEDGQTIIPIFISESVSDVYFRNSPRKKKEIIQKTKMAGVGLTDGSLVSQVIGSSFQQYNFYSNWLNLLEKDFVSPISESWKVYYEYYLADSVHNGTNWDYQIDFEPKHEQDLAFAGTMWVDGTSFALTQIDASVGQKANLNFIEKIKIQQSYELHDDDSTWLPGKTRVLIDVAEISNKSAGMLLKFYSANRNYILHAPKPPKFYDTAIELNEEYREHAPSYWEKNRPEVLSESEKLSYALVDSIKSLPVIHTYTELLNIAVNGYKKIDRWNIDLGPYLYLYTNNNIEGHRLRLGFRTDPGFSRKWILNAYGAYGTRDNRYKYGGGIDYILSRKPWTIAGASYRYDLEQLGISRELLGSNYLFEAFSRFGTYQRGYLQNETNLYLRREVVKGLTQQIALRHRSFDPLFPFVYRSAPEMGMDSPLRSRFEVAELNFETRLARQELFLQNDNERISMGNGNSPAFTLRYTAGIKGFLDGDFMYHKIAFNVRQSFRTGVIGRTNYDLTLGYIPSTLPYPLLYTPLGNESFFYVGSAFNLMNYFEFISDRYATLFLEHNFQGFILNRIPAIRKLKWRMLATGKVFYGGVRDSNLVLTPQVDNAGNPIETFKPFGNIPYVEVGYGIDNIFKVGRIDAIHRLTFRDSPDATRFGVKVSFWFSL
ncbi:DUF5686 and carboxypeptidase-like regulatory domain-containing protein [Telluribacter humicola]|uniref:DUF5686 and carboxypeptidase-like regulatory domain-containing protein n=1 Tax=Telluribacter humicola TaxID=1720261 RepID=UPI001A977307|nr:DUF5686 and carboxypeptidase-like regulatory domain-containing protein [Telluribacter humicola]